jgi:hypothetical protein
MFTVLHHWHLQWLSKSQFSGTWRHAIYYKGINTILQNFSATYCQITQRHIPNNSNRNWTMSHCLRPQDQFTAQATCWHRKQRVFILKKFREPKTLTAAVLNHIAKVLCIRHESIQAHSFNLSTRWRRVVSSRYSCCTPWKGHGLP